MSTVIGVVVVLALVAFMIIAKKKKKVALAQQQTVDMSAPIPQVVPDQTTTQAPVDPMATQQPLAPISDSPVFSL